ncbi:hypothetical protein C882_3560 [Caenispirillum salinarum AK4]|uniref:Uncharacterized protein n=1 Tax=Caenispirillum salinarum AK4 TaxID=1238182 RepID=K9H417_9PROT|nr:hypothetical protein C882_3560 [Caenispirillum salinarum AK4]
MRACWLSRARGAAAPRSPRSGNTGSRTLQVPVRVANRPAADGDSCFRRNGGYVDACLKNRKSTSSLRKQGATSGVRHRASRSRKTEGSGKLRVPAGVWGGSPKRAALAVRGRQTAFVHSCFRRNDDRGREGGRASRAVLP